MSPQSYNIMFCSKQQDPYYLLFAYMQWTFKKDPCFIYKW